MDGLNRLNREEQYSRFEDEHPPKDAPAFRSRRVTSVACASLQNEVLHRCRVLIAAMDGLPTVADRVDRIMAEVLETDGFWRAGGLGEVPPRAVFVEVQVHGIRALGRDIGEAIANWVAAARREVEGCSGDL